MKLLHGDCLEQMKTLPDNSIDAIVSDPPYGISFMAKKWDYDVPKVEVWQEAMRVLKPGGHALIACGTRTQHRMVVNIEDAGFEIRDVVSWVYGSGFPKSLNISKAIDKMDAAPATEAAKQWDGWGTALKPSSEFFTLCRKPLSEKTIAANVLKWGTGGINIDACRVGTDDKLERVQGSNKDTSTPNAPNNGHVSELQTQGRFPANLIHDGSQEVLDLFPETKSGSLKAGHKRGSGITSYDGGGGVVQKDYGNDQGSAARFFYCAKASKKDRDEGNHHPTVKPTALMQYLCRLITPAGGTVLDPFMGSGSTGKAAVREGFDFVGCELDADYYAIATARIEAEQNREPEEPDQKELF